MSRNFKEIFTPDRLTVAHGTRPESGSVRPEDVRYRRIRDRILRTRTMVIGAGVLIAGGAIGVAMCSGDEKSRRAPETGMQGGQSIEDISKVSDEEYERIFGKH